MAEEGSPQASQLHEGSAPVQESTIEVLVRPPVGATVTRFTSIFLTRMAKLVHTTTGDIEIALVDQGQEGILPTFKVTVTRARHGERDRIRQTFKASGYQVLDEGTLSA